MTQMGAPGTLTVGQQLVKRMGMLYSKIAFGDPCPEFNEEMLKILGVKGFFAWAGTAGGSADALLKKYGPFPAQLLTSVVAMLNGCTYCGKGHLFAANLHHFRDTGELFDIDEAHVYWLQRQHDDEVYRHFEAALEGERFAAPRRLVRRLFEIKLGWEGETTADDPWLEAINGAWDWATECTITLSVIDVPALDGVGKDRALVARYKEAREAWRQQRVEHPAAALDQPWQLTG